jgi:hypothetical protein
MAFPTLVSNGLGDVITVDDLEDNLDLVRNYLIGLDEVEFTNNTIRSENLVRPVLHADSFESTFQGLWAIEWGNLNAPASGTDRTSWGGVPKRARIDPRQVSVTASGGMGDYWATPIGRTIYLPEIMDVRINLAFDYITRSDPATTRYANGAGSGQVGGRWCLMVREREDGVEPVELSFSSQPIYPSNLVAASNTNFAARAHLLAFDQLGPGYVDIFLAYRRESGDTLALYSIDATRFIGTISAS